MKAEALQKIIGSLLVVGFEGTKLSDVTRDFLGDWDLGGVILFKRNIESLEQLSSLNESIYQAAKLTPLLSVDHEGGRVFRLPPPFTIFPPMRKLGDYCAARQDFQTAKQVGQSFARELRAVGFNLDYAPVLDVDSNPQNPIIGDRAFSSDPQEVADWALALAAGLESEGVMACGKHFPGHGDTSEDSHLTLPKVSKSREALEACELIPFRRAATQLSLLMTAHVMYPALDAEWPATLSDKILTGLLRKEMGYRGLIISDDFFMKGIVARWGLEEAAERFLRAGGDLVMLCHQEDAQRRVALYLLQRAEADSDFCRLLQEKVLNVQNFRKKLNAGLKKDFQAWIGSVPHQELAQLLQ